MDPELLALLERLRARRSSTATRAPSLEEQPVPDDVGVGAIPQSLEALIKGLSAVRRTIEGAGRLPVPAGQSRIADRASAAGRFAVENKLVPTSLQETIDAAGAMASFDRERLRETPGTLIPELIVSLLPGPGEAQAGRDVISDFKADDVGWGTALAGVGMVPIIGIAPRVARRVGGAVRAAGRAARGAGDLSDVGRVARKAERAVGAGGTPAGTQRVFHGSPKKFTSFSNEFSGAGQGEFQGGFGVAVSSSKDAAESFGRSVSLGVSPGFLYQASVQDLTGRALHLERTFGDQAPAVQKALRSLDIPGVEGMTGEEIYSSLVRKEGGRWSRFDDLDGIELSDVDIAAMRRASSTLESAGVAGTQYRMSGEDAFTIFNPEELVISRRESGIAKPRAPRAEEARTLKRIKETGFAEPIPGGGVEVRPGEFGRLDTVSAIKRAQNIVGKEQFDELARADIAARGGSREAAMAGTEDTARRIVREREAMTASVMERHAAGGGSTTHARTGEVPTEGYGVSTFKDREKVLDNPMTQADIDDYIQEHGDLLDQDDVFIGTWRDTEAGKDVIDVSRVLDDRADALSAGHEASQKAIWDFKLKKEVKVPKPERLPAAGSPQKVDELFAAGREGMDWYERLPAIATDIVGAEDAPMFIRFIAATSQNTKFTTLPTRGDNLNLARRVFAEWKAGEPFGTRGGLLPGMIQNLDLAAAGRRMTGPKIRAFERALMGDVDAIVLDRWMLRAYGYKNKSPADRIGQRLALEDAIRAGAKRHGVTNRQYQAAVWEGSMRRGGKFSSVVENDPLLRGADVFGKPLPEDFKGSVGDVLKQRVGRFASLQEFLDATVGGLGGAAIGTAAIQRRRQEQ